MYNKELEDLIQEYLTDGIISAKERQVLLNKAKELGLNVDEVDLYIDAQQQKADQAVATAMNKRRGKTCPYCGSSIPELSDKCPNCGGNITPEASQELEEIIDHLETALVNFKSGEDVEKSKAEVERYVRKARLYYGNNPKVKQLLQEVEYESEEAEEEARKNAKKKFWLDFFTKYKKGVIAIFVILLAGIIWAFFIPRPDNEIIADQTEQVTSLIESGKLAEANNFLVNITILKGVRDKGTNYVVSAYDAMFLAVIKEYLKNNDLDAADHLALAYRSKIGNDFSWEDSACLKLLLKKADEVGKLSDMSSLQGCYEIGE